MMFEETLIEREAIKLESYAHWRGEKAGQYPDDLRYLEAQELLLQLAGQVRKMAGRPQTMVFEILHDVIFSGDDDTDNPLEIVKLWSEYRSQVGFNNFPDDAEQYLAELMALALKTMRRTMSELYDQDVFEWSQHQAALLRRRAAGELVNEAELDWPNIAEEIEGVGNDQLRAVESFLVQALVHDLKSEAWPLNRAVSGWRAGARRFRGDAAARFTPAMRQRVDLAKIYRRALRAMPDTIDGELPLPVPETCPVTLDEIFNEEG